MKKMNPNLPKTSNGIRICVYKADRTKWTTVFASNAYLADVLAIYGHDIAAVTHQARYASLTCVQKVGETWTHAVLSGARRLLVAEAKKLAMKHQQAGASAAIKSEAETLSELAAENNATWEQVLADTHEASRLQPIPSSL